MWDLDDFRSEQGGNYGMGDKLYHGEDILRMDTIDKSSVLDGEVEKRLNDMVPIPVSTTYKSGKLLCLLDFKGFFLLILTEVPLQCGGSIISSHFFFLHC